jgi:small subunit ribosomal protein S6
MYILRPDVNEDALDQAINHYQNLLREQGAESVQTQHRGKRRLQYEINRYREGIYVQMNYKGSGSQVATLERAMRLSDDVIRYLTVKQEDEDPQSAEAEE